MKIRKAYSWRAAAIIAAGLFLTLTFAGAGFTQGTEALQMNKIREVPDLKIEKIKPIPQLDRPDPAPKPVRRVYRSSSAGDATINIDGYGTLYRVDAGTREMVINDSIVNLSDDVSYYVGSTEYKQRPAVIHEGAEVAYAEGEDGNVAKVWLYKDIEKDIRKD